MRGWAPGCFKLDPSQFMHNFPFPAMSDVEIGSASPAMAIAFLLFFIPVSMPFRMSTFISFLEYFID